jgi:hypothetical protein
VSDGWSARGRRINLQGENAQMFRRQLRRSRPALVVRLLHALLGWIAQPLDLTEDDHPWPRHYNYNYNYPYR